MRAHFKNAATLMVVILTACLATAAQAQLANGTFEAGTALGNPDNATSWNWTPDQNGERVNALTNNSANDGSGSPGTHLIDPLGGSWFGYAENGTNDLEEAQQPSGQIAQFNVSIPIETPVLTFWWRFFTNETPGGGNTFNDKFRVDVEGSSSVLANVATVNGTSMISTNGPLWTPLGSPSTTNPGQGQSFARYTASWLQYSLDLSALAGETVTVYFDVLDVGASHSQSSGFALDNVELIVPEPASLGLIAAGAVMTLRRRRA